MSDLGSLVQEVDQLGRGGLHFHLESLEGAGEIRVFDDPEPCKVSLRSDMGGPLELRWASLGENIWHQPVAGMEDWIVLTFHTASEAELIDEYKEKE